MKKVTFLFLAIAALNVLSCKKTENEASLVVQNADKFVGTFNGTGINYSGASSVEFSMSVTNRKISSEQVGLEMPTRVLGLPRPILAATAKNATEITFAQQAYGRGNVLSGTGRISGDSLYLSLIVQYTDSKNVAYEQTEAFKGRK